MPAELGDYFDAFRRDAVSTSAEAVTLRAAADRQARTRSALLVTAALAVTGVAGVVMLLGPAAGGPSPATSGGLTTAPATASPVPPPPSQGQRPSGTFAPCTTTQLALLSVGRADFTDDLLPRYAATVLGFQNTSSKACAIRGYPVVQLIDADGGPLPTMVIEAGGHPQPIVLQYGDIAYFTLASYNPQTEADKGAPCQIPADGMTISRPGNTRTLTLMGSWQACGRGRVNVGPLTTVRDPNWHS